MPIDNATQIYRCCDANVQYNCIQQQLFKKRQEGCTNITEMIQMLIQHNLMSNITLDKIQNG